MKDTTLYENVLVLAIALVSKFEDKPLWINFTRETLYFMDN